jgi:hypothetical protein
VSFVTAMQKIGHGARICDRCRMPELPPAR